MRVSKVSLSVIVVALSLPAIAEDHVHVVATSYRGWEHAYRIFNSSVELVVVPEVGRVMRYGRIGGDNVLWEYVGVAPGVASSSWTDIGGDVLWVAPQSNDTWPPSPSVDPGPYSVEVLPTGIRISGPSDARLKVRIDREITLAETGSTVTFKNRMKNVGPPRKLAPWQVTEIDNPNLVVLQIHPSRQQPNGFFVYGGNTLTPGLQEVHGQELWLRRDISRGRKFGSTDRSGEIKATKHGVTFHSIQEVFQKLTYPDHDSAQQVFLSADPMAYAQLEQVGPLRTLETNEVAIQTVQWFLSDKH